MTTKWTWKMDYCEKNGLPPAQDWAWSLAESAWRETKARQFSSDDSSSTIMREDATMSEYDLPKYEESVIAKITNKPLRSECSDLLCANITCERWDGNDWAILVNDKPCGPCVSRHKIEWLIDWLNQAKKEMHEALST
jgi:hypothetical protein